MKVLLHGKHSKNIKPLVKSLGFEVVTSDPKIIVSYGGDGTLLSAEREYPQIPKLPIRNSQFCKKCAEHEDEIVLKKLKNGNLELKEYKKLHTNIEGKDLYALNDFVIRNELPTHAIRFKTSDKLLIGDGIVVSTPFGSTGYFKSISKESFKQGFGVALNNTTEGNGPIYFDEDDPDTDELEFELIRGKAILTLDNDPNIFHLSEGTKLTFKLSDKVAKIYEDTSLRCPNCQVLRG